MNKTPHSKLISLLSEITELRNSYQNNKARYDDALLRNPEKLNLGADVLKYMWGINKKTTKNMAKIIDTNWELTSEHRGFKSSFNKLLNNTDNFLNRTSIKTKNLQFPGNSHELSAKLNSIFKAVRLDTKMTRLKMMLESIQNLNLIYNIDITSKPKLVKIKNKNLKRLLKEPEGPKLEFKKRVPSQNHLAKLISSFANSQGGTIIFGVSDDKTLEGINNIESAISNITAASVEINPPVNIEINIIEELNKSILIVEIPIIDKSLHVTEKGIYQRIGSSVSTITSDTLVEKFTDKTQTQNQENSTLTILAGTIETLSMQFEKSNSFSNRIKDHLLGALIGGIIGIFLSISLGGFVG